MRNKFVIFSFLIFCLLSLPHSLKAGYGFSIELLSEELVRVAPGRTASFTVRVTNISDKDLDCVARVYVPQELGASVPDPLHFNLVSSRSSTQQISILVPRKAEHGNYRLQYSVDSNENPIYNDSIDLTIEVKR